MDDLTTDSDTNRSPHTASSKAAFVTSWPGRSAKKHSTANGLGGSATGRPPLHSSALATSS